MPRPAAAAYSTSRSRQIPKAQGSEQGSLAPEALVASVAVESALDLCFGKAGEQVQQNQGAADGADRAVVFRQSCESAANTGKDNLLFRSLMCHLFSLLPRSDTVKNMIWRDFRKANVFLAAALAACLCLSACSRQQSNSGSSADEISSSGSEAQNSGSEPGSEEVPSDESGSTEQGDLLSADEIAGIFKDLDARSAEIVDEWVNRDYTQIPIDGVPTHILENAVIGVRGVENENGSGFVPVYGDCSFRKGHRGYLTRLPLGKYRGNLCSNYRCLRIGFRKLWA